MEVETHLEAERIGAQYTVKEHSEIADLAYTNAGLRVVVATSPLGSLAGIWVEYLFDEVAALRCLATADMSPDWRGAAFEPGYHLHRVLRGGWLEQELRTPGTLDVTTAASAPPEWLITTRRQSLSVLGAEPLVREHPRVVSAYSESCRDVNSESCRKMYSETCRTDRS